VRSPVDAPLNDAEDAGVPVDGDPALISPPTVPIAVNNLSK